MALKQTEEVEIGKILNIPKNQKSPGHDGISNEILKCCSPIIEQYLCGAFKNCILEQRFPNSMNMAKVIAMSKKAIPQNLKILGLLAF